MRAIAFLTQKGGAGKTTLAASLAAAAVNAGERVIALDLDPLRANERHPGLTRSRRPQAVGAASVYQRRVPSRS